MLRTHACRQLRFIASKAHACRQLRVMVRRGRTPVSGRRPLNNLDRVVRLTEIGCPFYDRCPLAVEGTCDRETPPIRRLADGHAIECHRSEEEFMH